MPDIKSFKLWLVDTLVKIRRKYSQFFDPDAEFRYSWWEPLLFDLGHKFGADRVRCSGKPFQSLNAFLRDCDDPEEGECEDSDQVSDDVLIVGKLIPVMEHIKGTSLSHDEMVLCREKIVSESDDFISVHGGRRRICIVRRSD